MEGQNFFEVSDNEDKEIRRYLAEVVGMLGPPPRDLVQRMKKRKEVFLEDSTPSCPHAISVVRVTDGAAEIGEWNGGFLISKPDRPNLDKAGKRLNVEDRVKCVAFLKIKLQWRPEDRKTARELLSDP